MSMKKHLSMTLPAALVGWFLMPGMPAEAAAPLASQYHVVTVRSAPSGAHTMLGGTVVPLKEVSFSAQMPGRVEFIAGVEGDWFDKGTILVALDDDDLLAKRRAAYAQYLKAQAGLRNSRVQYTRQVYSGSAMESENSGMAIPKMFDRYMTRPFSGVIGADNPEVTRRAQIWAQGTQIDSAKASVMEVLASLQELDAKLRDTKTIAPFTGTIVQKHVEVGDTVQPGMPLLQFADIRHLQIKVDVPARLMPGVKSGMTIPAKLDVGDTHIETRVAQIFPMADPQRHTVTVKLDLPANAPGGPGMYAEVMIPDVTSPVEQLPTIPRSAIIWRGSLPAVYVVASGSNLELRMIRLGGESMGENAVKVLSGLQVGERIVTNPPTGLSGGAWKQNSANPAGNP
uniref:Putative Efflux transporter, RND family, MFP subunit n=1 Tax=Magnetococcus massalia (strain MO-1) TaxID=451514 RepID=A0A1S7LJM0_MAGMO|nr:putative Efflux transporter, RND family, MFP subunit [Candidatus Magnetococcus massalia]